MWISQNVPRATLVWLFAVAAVWALPWDTMPQPSGYGGLSREDQRAVDVAIDTASQPVDPLLRRVADEYASRVMRVGEPGRKHVIGLALAAVVACVLAAQWWVLVLWLGVVAFAARSTWKRRGLATQARRYLTAPR